MGKEQRTLSPSNRKGDFITMKKKSQLNQKIEAVTLRTLVVGIDVAKERQ